MRDVAGLPPDEIDALRSSPIWPDMVDAAHTLPRELAAIVGYEFEAPRFADLDTPTLLLTGGESPPLYRDATGAVADALPNSRVATFEGEGHMAMHTAPERFVEAVLGFVRGPD